MDNSTKVITILYNFAENPGKMELLYIFLVTYYQYYREYIEYVVHSGGRWILLQDLVYEQFRARGFDPSKPFNEFQKL